MLTSPVIDRPDKDVPDIPYAIRLYPNRATDRLYISVDEKLWGNDVNVTALTLLGKSLFNKTFKITDTGLEIPISEISEKFLVLSIEGTGLSHSNW